ncbi:MAG TPA: protein translocase subunit SecD [Candidatus Saccharimonadales bacterium]|nr:protein translocase subunit SecD [Candidatus Saccharimonadales bacterium]
MKSRTRVSLIFVAFLTLVVTLINVASPAKIDFTGINPSTLKPIPVHYSYPGIPFITKLRDLSFRLGLDLQGGSSITLRANMKDVPQSERDSALASAREVIEKRINFFGVSEPVVQTEKANDDYRILVDIPGVTDINQAVSLVGKTAKLTFWEGSGAPSATDAAQIATQSALLDLKAGRPIGVTQAVGANPKQTNLSGNDLKQAAVTFDSSSGAPQVQLTFTADGAKKFADITSNNVGKIVAIALDQQVIEAPRVQAPIVGGNAVITGNFTTQTANDLAIQLNAGALPVSLTVLQQQAIGATLGQSSLKASLIAGVLGFLVIIIFMIVLYGRLGVIASLALVIYSLTVLSLFRLIPVTLTLAGIAGFILSVGIAVDANILIFERMKEELRRGRTLATAIDLGFARAWPSIRDSNVSSLITSIVLFYFGTSIIRGFAVTLALGIIVSMLSAIFVTRTFLQVFYKRY